jgi:PPK2 family polyphosphate:nucleotide phosphotransferase
MDAAGKDGIIKHVLAGFNQQSCHVTAFSAPAGDELSHTYLWRCMAATPARGHIGVFNRSYYEEVLVPRVHPEYITAQRIPGACVSDDITTLKSRGSAKSLRNHNPTAHPPPEFWQSRLDDINAFERHLVRNGTRVVKFYLHISRGEQKRRILQRIEDPARNWKFAANDLRDRHYWREYEHAYSQLLTQTSTPWAPWHIIPADHKYIARLAVARVLRAELDSLHPQFPRLDKHGRKTLAKARKILEDE